MKRLLFFIVSFVVGLSSYLFAQEENSSDKYYNTVQVDFVGNDEAKVSMNYQMKKRKDGAWRIRIPKEDLLEETIVAVDIKIPACNAKKGEDGYFITTTSAIGTFKKDEGIWATTRNYYTFFGMKNPRTTWVAIVKKLKLEWSQRIEIKDGNYQVFPRFNIKNIGFKPYEDIVVDFYELKGKDASYVGMAKKYRQYQLKRGEVKPLKERIKDNPKLEMMAKSILLRAQHGGKPILVDKTTGKWIPKDQTLETEPKMHVACTCDQVTECIKALKEMGCDNLVFHEVGWNIRGHDGRYPQLLPVEPAIGGEKALKRTIETAKSLGYYISPHVNHTDAYRIADRWSEDYIAKLKNGELMYVGCWAGGKAYTPCPHAIFDLFIKDDYPMLRDRLGFNGLHHVDVISAITPRVCHDPKHPLNRKEWTKAYLRIMKYAHELTGGFTSECGFDHVIKYLDWAFYINHKNRYSDILDRYLPVWQLVYHGIVPSSAFFSDTNNNLTKDWEEIRLHHAEFGGRPVYYGAWTNIRNLPKVKELYDEYQNVAYLQLEFMEDHKQLAPDVYLTAYGDGSEVITNYSNEQFDYKGKTVKPRDYLLIKGKKAMVSYE